MREVGLGDVAFEVKERAGSREGSLPVFGVDKYIGLTSEPRYQAKDLSRYKAISPGMFAYNPMRLNIGSIGYCFPDIGEGLVSPDYVVFGCNSKFLLPEYFFYHTKSSPWRAWLSLAGEGSVRERIYFRKLATYSFVLPSLHYQTRAIAVLGSLDSKIELNRRVNETLEAMAQSIFRDWFVDFGPTRRKMDGENDAVTVMGGLVQDAVKAKALADLFPAKLDDGGLPEGWRAGVASSLIEFNPKEPLKKGSLAPYSDMSSLPTVGSVAEPPVQREYGSGMRFKNGDALLARITPCLENGKAAFVDFLSDQSAVGWGSTEFYVLRARQGVPAPCAYLLVRHPEFRAVAIASMTGTSGRQRAQVDRLEEFPFVVPPQEALTALGDVVLPMFDKISANGRESQTLAATRDFLLPKLMSGEIRLTQAEELMEAAQ